MYKENLYVVIFSTILFLASVIVAAEESEKCSATCSGCLFETKDFVTLMQSSQDRDIDTVFSWLYGHWHQLNSANINTQNKDGSTLLHLHVHRPPIFYTSRVTENFAKPLSLEYLMGLGASLHVTDNQNNTPLNTAIKNHNELMTHQETRVLPGPDLAHISRRIAIQSYDSLIGQLSAIVTKQRQDKKNSPSNKNQDKRSG